MTTDAPKPPRVRSVAYPSISFADALEITHKIYKIFGNTTYSARQAIAKNLHISESHLQSRVSSCVQFGLLDLRSKEGYKPSELYIKIRNPLPDEDVEDAFVASFSHPDLYRELIEQFNGKRLPEQEGLATILSRKHKVADKVSSFAAKIFIQSAVECGFLNEEDRLFNIHRDLSTPPDNIEFEVERQKDTKTNDQVIYLPPSSSPIEKSDIPPIPIFLDNGEVAKLYMPKGFSKEDLKRVAKVLAGYIE